MPTKTSPITPAVLAWAIDQDGRSLSEIATSSGCTQDLLNDWTNGDALPTVGQVSKLASVLHRPRAFFFLPRPPAEAALPSGFRHPPGGGDRAVSQSVLLEARRSKRLQRAIAAVLPADRSADVPLAQLRDDPARVAGLVRTWLGVLPSEAWGDAYAALRRWRQALDAVGVLVFSLQLGADELRGFASWDDRAPLIVVNTSRVNPSARIFTIGHELAHLVLREATACLEPRGGRISVDSRTERWCESFSAALLMPLDEVRRLMRSRDVRPEQAGVNEVSALMSRFRVSARAAAIRLEELGYAEPTLYAQVLAVFKPNPRKEGDARSPARHTARLRQYGEHTIETIMTSLPPRDAMAVLRIDAEDARKLADEVPGVVAI
jgi:Zn-dependent peptidase ImmA (M78 family)/transcriptional regulator with XRE-family HTH domain